MVIANKIHTVYTILNLDKMHWQKQADITSTSE
jgi:hypothetical protein